MPPGIVPPLASGGVEPAVLGAGGGGALVMKPGMTMAEIERAAIESALRETRGNRRKAAEILAIGERTLYRKLKEYNLPLGQYDSDN
jgi:DNA-binding NtrC family response regulator